MLPLDTIQEMTQMEWSDIGCTYGDRLKVACKDGSEFVGMFVDFEVDFDGSYGGDSVSLVLDDKRNVSIREDRIEEMTPIIQ